MENPLSQDQREEQHNNGNQSRQQQNGITSATINQFDSEIIFIFVFAWFNLVSISHTLLLWNSSPCQVKDDIYRQILLCWKDFMLPCKSVSGVRKASQGLIFSQLLISQCWSQGVFIRCKEKGKYLLRSYTSVGQQARQWANWSLLEILQYTCKTVNCSLHLLLLSHTCAVL